MRSYPLEQMDNELPAWMQAKNDTHSLELASYSTSLHLGSLYVDDLVKLHSFFVEHCAESGLWIFLFHGHDEHKSRVIFSERTDDFGASIEDGHFDTIWDRSDLVQLAGIPHAAGAGFLMATFTADDGMLEITQRYHGSCGNLVERLRVLADSIRPHLLVRRCDVATLGVFITVSAFLLWLALGRGPLLQAAGLVLGFVVFLRVPRRAALLLAGLAAWGKSFDGFWFLNRDEDRALSRQTRRAKLMLKLHVVVLAALGYSSLRSFF